MRRHLFALALLALLAAIPALAEEAPDITASCVIAVNSDARTAHRISDRRFTSVWEGDAGGRTVTIKCAEPAYGLYICWGEDPRAWTLEQKVGGVWRSAEIGPSPFLHMTVPLEGAAEIRMRPSGVARAWFSIAELFVLGKGETPSWVQEWRLPDGECDLLALFAHPDDEAIFLGGTIPYYAGERGLDVVAVVLTGRGGVRRGELLNSLWAMGLRQYPVVGGFGDRHSLKLATAYRNAGETKVKRFVVDTFRAYRPKVVVTHDLMGEYGHGVHQMCADAALYAFHAAADPGKFAASAGEHGAWQVSKLYLHLWPENTVVMDWDRPLAAFGGRTGFEMAQEGYAKHASQHRLDFVVEGRDSPYSSYRFGLARTAVGPDAAGADFMEHVTAYTSANPRGGD